MDRFTWLRNMALGKVLEVGCADGVVYRDVHVIEWTGVDLEFKEEWLPTLKDRDFKVMDGYKLDFPKNHFDTLVYAEILEHVLDPIGLIEHGIQFLKPNGRILITVPDEYSWDEELKPFENESHIHFFNQEEVEGIVYNISNTEVKFFTHTPRGWNMGFVFWYIMMRKCS